VKRKSPFIRRMPRARLCGPSPHSEWTIANRAHDTHMNLF